MIQIVDIAEKEKWNSIITSFDKWDIYYTNEYAYSLMLHGDGIPFLVHWVNDTKEVCYVIMKDDISKDKSFSDCLESGLFFDAMVPYGYGGPIIKGILDEKDIKNCIDEINSICRSQGIISQFLRFHPLFDEQSVFYDYFDAKTFKSTIYIDTINEEKIWSNMDSSNRNMIRKAQKSGVTIEFDKGERLDEFIDVYNSTMDSHNAEEYYYFNREYFEYLINEMCDNIIFAYSILEEKIIGASIFFYNKEYMHYHLSGTYREYKQYASTNLLLYEAAKWASQKGIKKLHLGGGISSEDSLFKFKKKFNKYGIRDFYVGRLISNEEKYRYLLQLRKEKDDNFDVNNGFMIQYRR